MKVLINYANSAYRKAQKLNTWSGYHIAKFDKVIEYNDSSIDSAFHEENKKILSVKRGNGLWLWKPYIIYKTLLALNEDDILFYCDSGAMFLKKPDAALDIVGKEGLWVSRVPLLEEQFTKREIFEFFDADNDDIKKTAQLQGSFIALRKCDKSIKIIRKWLECCCQEELISNHYDEEIQYDDFIAGREDQSILSVLLKKEGIKGHTDPSQYSKLPEIYWYSDKKIKRLDPGVQEYKPFIYLHRGKKVTPRIVILCILYYYLPRRIGLSYLKHKYHEK